MTYAMEASAEIFKMLNTRLAHFPSACLVPFFPSLACSRIAGTWHERERGEAHHPFQPDDITLVRRDRDIDTAQALA